MNIFFNDLIKTGIAIFILIWFPFVPQIQHDRFIRFDRTSREKCSQMLKKINFYYTN